jgi:predicted transposase YdaD
LKKHDRSFRLLFSQPRLIEDLMRRFVGRGGTWIDDLDFSTLERVSTAHISEALASRDGDVGWRVRLKSAPIFIYLLVEFQSTNDRFMALRESVYMGLFLQQILKQGGLTPEGLLPWSCRSSFTMGRHGGWVRAGRPGGFQNHAS